MKGTPPRLLLLPSMSLVGVTHHVLLSPASAFSPPTRYCRKVPSLIVDTHPRVLASRQQDLSYNLPLSERDVCGRYDANQFRKGVNGKNARHAAAGRSISSNAASATLLRMASKDEDTTNEDESHNRDDSETKSEGEDNTENVADGDNTDEVCAEEKKKAVAAKPPSYTRVGGRTRSSFVPPSPHPPRNSDSSKGLLLKIGLPIALLLALIKVLLGGLFGPPAATTSSNFVYYQSSMYESRIVGADGNVQTTRKQSMRSNIPSLMGSQEQRGGSDSQPSEIRRYLDRGGRDIELDREVDSEVAESMREARQMMRGMGFTDFSSLDPYSSRLNRRLVDDGAMTAISTSGLDRQIENEMQNSLRDLDGTFGMRLWDDLASFDRY